MGTRLQVSVETINGSPLCALGERNVDGFYPIAQPSPRGGYHPIPIEPEIGLLITKLPLYQEIAELFRNILTFSNAVIVYVRNSNSGNLDRLLAVAIQNSAKGRSDINIEPESFGSGFLFLEN
jgi:hypothetical protein